MARNKRILLALLLAVCEVASVDDDPRLDCVSNDDVDEECRNPPSLVHEQDEEEEEEEEECDVGSMHDFLQGWDRHAADGTDYDARFDKAYHQERLRSYSDDPPSDNKQQRRTCQRVHADTVTPIQLYRDYMTASKPVVIAHHTVWQNFAQNGDWTLEALLHAWGPDTVLPVRFHSDSAFQGITHFPGQGYKYVAPARINITLREFATTLQAQQQQASRSEYLNLQSLPLRNNVVGGGSGDDWMDQMEHPMHFPPHVLQMNEGESVAHLEMQNLWISEKDKVSQLHNDPYDNLLVVLQGTKTLYLVDPVFTPFLYPGYFPVLRNERLGPGRYRATENLTNFDHDDVIGHFVPVNFDALLRQHDDDAVRNILDRFPAVEYLLQQNAILECHLKPGDILVLPALWWHQVYNHVLEPHPPQQDNGTKYPVVNVAVNYWFRAHEQLDTLRDLHLDLYAMDWVTQGPAGDAYLEQLQRERRRSRRTNAALGR